LEASEPAASESEASESGALGLEELLERVDETIEVQRARIAHETAMQEMELAAMRSDPSLIISPGIRADGYEDRDEVDRWAATFNVNATVPLGLSRDQRERLDRSRDAATVARVDLEQVRADQTLRIVRLYHDAWLGRQEIAVLEREVAVQREQARIERLRFEQGEISWDALLRADAEYRERQANLSDAIASNRSAVIDLALAVGLAPDQLHQLESPVGLVPSGIPAGDTSRSATPPFSAVIAQEHILGGALREADRRSTFFSQATIRAGADLGDHSSTLSYSILAPSVAVSYSPAPFVLSDSSDGAVSSGGSGGSTSGSSSDFDWTISLGVTLGITGTRTERAEQERLNLVVEREEALLGYLIAREEAILDRTQALVAQAERNLTDALAARERAEVALEIVETRSRTGQARQVELDQARAARYRSEFNVERSQLALEAALMELASLADSR
jgi:outer membrane protein TolC